MSKVKKEVPKEIKELLEAHPALMLFASLVAFKVLTSSGGRPAWLDDCPRIHERLAGPWRGKGSFGHGFGPTKVRHR